MILNQGCIYICVVQTMNAPITPPCWAFCSSHAWFTRSVQTCFLWDETKPAVHWGFNVLQALNGIWSIGARVLHWRGRERAAAGFPLDCNKKGLSTNSVLKYCFNKIVGTSDVPSDAGHPAFVHLDGPGMDFSYGRLHRSVCVEGLFPPVSRCLLFCSNHGSSNLLLTAWKRYLCYNIHQLTAQAGPEHTIVTEATPC